MKILIAAVPDGPLHLTIEPMMRPWSSNDDANNLFAPLGVLRVAEYIENNGLRLFT